MHKTQRKYSVFFVSHVFFVSFVPFVSFVGAQAPTYKLGRTPSAQELRALDIDVLPDGRGLPPGSGTAAAGKVLYDARCVTCHGATGKEGPQDILVGGRGTLATEKPLKTVGSYWPYATTLFDYISRAMPFDHPGTLTTDQVYAATAYVLFINDIVGECDVVSHETLPKIAMPNRAGFVADTRPDTKTAARPKALDGTRKRP